MAGHLGEKSPFFDRWDSNLKTVNYSITFLAFLMKVVIFYNKNLFYFHIMKYFAIKRSLEIKICYINAKVCNLSCSNSSIFKQKRWCCKKNPLQIPPENRTFFSILLFNISDGPKPPISTHPTKKNNCMLGVK